MISGSAWATTPRGDLEIKRSGSQPSTKGPADWFTGTVRIDPLFDTSHPARAAGASVTFEPGARTAWHTHPLGQTLIVTSGVGRAQRWGGPVEEIRPGDVSSTRDARAAASLRLDQVLVRPTAREGAATSPLDGASVAEKPRFWAAVRQRGQPHNRLKEPPVKRLAVDRLGPGAPDVRNMSTDVG